MNLAELLSIRSGITAVIGGGGKTTLLRALGTELAADGARVLLCATTKLFPFADLPNLADPTETALAEALEARRLVCAGTPVPGTGKLTAPNIPVARLAALADYVLAEADGAAGRPLKAHAPHEPVIPPEANQTVLVIGASGFGRPIAEAAHRPALYARLAGAEESAPRLAGDGGGGAAGGGPPHPGLYQPGRDGGSPAASRRPGGAAVLPRPGGVP